MLSANLKRRHLTPDQRAMIATEALPYFEAEARERKAEAGRKAAPGRPAEKDRAESPTVSDRVARSMEYMAETIKGRARDQAGAAAGVAGRKVQAAKRVATKAPDPPDRRPLRTDDRQAHRHRRAHSADDGMIAISPERIDRWLATEAQAGREVRWVDNLLYLYTKLLPWCLPPGVFSCCFQTL